MLSHLCHVQLFVTQTVAHQALMDFQVRNTEVGCYFLFQGSSTQRLNCFSCIASRFFTTVNALTWFFKKNYLEKVCWLLFHVSPKSPQPNAPTPYNLLTQMQPLLLRFFFSFQNFFRYKQIHKTSYFILTVTLYTTLSFFHLRVIWMKLFPN